MRQEYLDKTLRQYNDKDAPEALRKEYQDNLRQLEETKKQIQDLKVTW